MNNRRHALCRIGEIDLAQVTDLALALAVSHRHRVPGFHYVQPNINFAMLVRGSSSALRKGARYASNNLADLAVWDEPPSSARTCGHTVSYASFGISACSGRRHNSAFVAPARQRL